MEAGEAADLLRRREAVALDVRETAEWTVGRIGGSLHIPLGQLGRRQTEIPRGTTIIAVCRTGNRSRTATNALRAAGYRAENLEGGLKGWLGAGLPLEPSGGRVI